MDPKDLAESSRRWMGMALSALTRPQDVDMAVHHAVVACEHLLKAYLASLHPVLVAEGKDFTSLLHATGHGDKAKRTDLTAFQALLYSTWFAPLPMNH
jgi:hypothetical protein